MGESVHKKLDRVRKPRVHITYEVETGGAPVKKELPFVVGVLGDFSGNPTEPLKPMADRKFIQVDRDNFDDVMARMTPGLNLKVENTIKGDGSEMAVQLKFNKMEDFEPVKVAEQVEPLKKLLEAREKLKTLLTDMDRGKVSEDLLGEILENTENVVKAAKRLGVDAPAEGDKGEQVMSPEAEKKPEAAAQAETKEESILDKVLEATPKNDRSRVEDLMGNLIRESVKGTVTWDKNVTRTLTKGIEAIDAVLSKQLAAIMHHPDFQKLEGTWRGFSHLVFNSETSAQLKVKVFNASKKDLFKDLDRAVEFDQSQMFKKLYENEFGMPGGEPYGALIGDYEFTNHPEDIDMLTKISGVAAAAFCPFISAASPELFGFKDFTELSKPRDLERIFDTIEYTKWKSFRESEDSRFVTMVMPRVLSRLPYGKLTKPVDEFNFEEVALDQKGKSKKVPHNQYAWMNAAYVMGTKLTEAFSKTGWCTAIRGVENGGKVEGLPAHIFTSDDGDPDLKCPSEIGITDRREAELSKLGFLPICHFKGTDYSVFFGAQTAQKPKVYGPRDTDATANAAISARLPYMMATSRIAHYLKVIARDKIGAFMEASDCQDWLTRWIADYICADSKPSAEMKAKFPLAEAKIEVQEVPGKPGSYQAIAWLRPWLQMEELTTSLRMVAKIPQLSK